ncbi:glycosyl-4,4'-diaponeurosporenoate acyltransferase [Alkalibacterium indicireducens]|uniref:glycosyl-4,4'-diaponeurosporenoate acyltransferase CrtO family protein n=1 Tax=Alkalibacterium indicireducens TaxID=398758 RepID=UPI0031F930D6
MWVNIAVWLFFHVSISLGLLKVPYSYFGPDHPSDILFRERSFEQKGKLWRNVFYVHKWKDRLPDGASLFKMGYKKKQLADTTVETMQLFIMEMKRAELTHLLLLLPAPLFFLWNPVWAGFVMVFYAIIVNVPFIIIQRYNRIRLAMIAQRRYKRR